MLHSYARLICTMDTHTRTHNSKQTYWKLPGDHNRHIYGSIIQLSLHYRNYLSAHLSYTPSSRIRTGRMGSEIKSLRIEDRFQTRYGLVIEIKPANKEKGFSTFPWTPEKKTVVYFSNDVFSYSMVPTFLSDCSTRVTVCVWYPRVSKLTSLSNAVAEIIQTHES